jgi:cytochrome c oxidase assembly protein subunit 15
MKKQLFFQSAVVSTILSYLLIFVGGLVRVSGSGMGCPDWPRCFGRWIPPTNVEQIPSYIDPTAFNIVLAWIEYGNTILNAVGSM